MVAGKPEMSLLWQRVAEGEMPPENPLGILRRTPYTPDYAGDVVLFFGDSFVGTAGDCAKVFLWGFTSDIGVNVLVDQAKGWVK